MCFRAYYKFYPHGSEFNFNNLFIRFAILLELITLRIAPESRGTCDHNRDSLLSVTNEMHSTHKQSDARTKTSLINIYI